MSSYDTILAPTKKKKFYDEGEFIKNQDDTFKDFENQVNR